MNINVQLYSIEISSFHFKWFIAYTVPQLFDASVIISEFTISSVSTKCIKEYSNIINVKLRFIHPIMQSSKTTYFIFSSIELFVLRRLPSYASINK